jgi:predicted GNAT family N-acyltransferase
MTDVKQFYYVLIEFGTPEFDEALALRTRVLRKPLNMVFNPEDIALEYDSYHLACYEYRSAEMVGILILKPISADKVKMRQVAVDFPFQSKGVGSLMVKESEKIAKKLGFHLIELHARETAVPFYLKAGYEIKGEKFKEVGIDHLYMFKNI